MRNTQLILAKELIEAGAEHSLMALRDSIMHVTKYIDVSHLMDDDKEVVEYIDEYFKCVEIWVEEAKKEAEKEYENLENETLYYVYEGQCDDFRFNCKVKCRNRYEPASGKYPFEYPGINETTFDIVSIKTKTGQLSN